MSFFGYGYIFKKKNVMYKNKNREFFIADSNEIGFIRDDEFFPFTGPMADKPISVCGGPKEGEYVAVTGPIEHAYEKLNVKSLDILRGSINILGGYYERSTNGDGLRRIQDKDFIRFLDSTLKESKKEFDEGGFEKESNISNMYSTVKQTIIAEDEQIMRILTALFKNQTVISKISDADLISKLRESILIAGPTGTGKTEILKRIAKIYEIPIVIEDSTSLSETGYVGRKITDMLEDLYMTSGKDLELAEKGILVLDEFDKLAEKSEDHQSHVSRLGVQRSLLKLLDGSEFYFDGIKFDTSKLTVVAIGAFSGIKDKDTEYKSLTIQDFVNYGVMRELMGRFSKYIIMNPLKKEDIVKILLESNFSPINTYRTLFNNIGIGFEYTNEFIEWIAEQAVEMNSGARSIKTLFDNYISGALFKIFAGEYSSIKLIKPENEEDLPYTLTKGKPKVKEKK